MRIARIQAWWVRIPIEAARQHKSDFGQITTFDAAIVRVETDTGIVGWGEGKNAAGSAGTYGALVSLINNEIAPALRGRDARDINGIWEMLYNGVRHQKAAASGHVMPVLARRGLTVAAISAIDIALWDILGKSLGVPVWQLLGGRKSERMPAYASGGWASADKIGEQLQSYIDKGGFKAVKMRVGSMDGAPHVSSERVHAAREALGPGVSIMVDAHGTYTVADAKRFAHMVRDCDLAWFEEPVAADDKQGIAEVRAACGIPIAVGESEATRFDFRDLAVARAADVFQPDLGFCGGISEAMKIGAIASAFNIRLAPHLWAGAPAFYAGLHVCAASPSSFILEYSLGANPMLHDLVVEKLDVAEGTIAIPDAPGLGITVDEDFLKAHAMGG
ncbi:mandelate racemase/muconate lactonizing enzyme family protein [Mesorhizobium sp. J428]|uniref:mandelate racemase/muconate lactonizing enzyme family protein n=1 Tax=Mesorhizobium sp. J428 TaxID=2898440 RepID=UPI002151437E|nr:mandelate racemase/muconate lactonizing enzyme family protein [Mesorhizobium sp. J428]MCR5857654.1 mandelate racemase/muconate lactonizing enzyme family protein [Mesorhizobium sp. J428]